MVEKDSNISQMAEKDSNTSQTVELKAYSSKAINVFKIKEYAIRSWNLMNIEASHSKTLLIILGIAFFSLATYFLSTPKNSNIRRTKISIATEKLPPPTIGGFYHFSTVNTPWRYIVYEQMLLARVSGLFDASLNIYVTGLGRIEENKTISHIFADPKFVYEYDTNTAQYEFPTLKKLEKFCLDHNNSLVWYAHSKGASHATDFAAGWRFILNTFVLDKWHLCYDLLSSTNYTTCGAVLTLDSVRSAGWNTYYAGNMWWAKCSHVNRLTRFEKIDQNDRYMAELYVTSEPDVGHFNCYFINPHESWTFNKETVNCTVNQPLWKVR